MTKKADSVKINFIYQSAYQILNIILPLITTPYISRVLGAEGIGIYSYKNSIMYFFLMFANLGILDYGNKIIATYSQDKKRLSKEFFSLYYLHAILSVICFICYLLYLLFFDSKYKLVSICQSLQIIAMFFDISWFFSGIQKFKITV